MKLTLKDTFADYENNETKHFQQFKLVSDIIVPKEADAKPYVEAVLLYDSEKGHKLLEEHIQLDLVWLLTCCEIHTVRVIPAKTCSQENPNSDERQFITAQTLDDISEYKLYNAKPGCRHIIVPQYSGIKCHCCDGWYCG